MKKRPENLCYFKLNHYRIYFKLDHYRDLYFLGISGWGGTMVVYEIRPSH